MKFSIKKETFKKILDMAGRGVSSRSTLPVLSNVLLSADMDRNVLTVKSTDLQLGICIEAHAQVEDSGEITVPYNVLAGIVGKAFGDKITVEMEVRTMSISVKTARSRNSVNGIDAADFPIITPMAELEAEGGMVETIQNKDVFLSAIQLGSISAGTDQSRETLMCVSLVCKDGEMTVATTDGYRLSRTVSKADVDFGELLIRRDSVVAASRIVKQLDGPMSMLVPTERNRVIFSASDDDGDVFAVEVTMIADQSNFPQYEAIIPKQKTTTMEVNALHMIAALESCNVFSKEHDDIVILSIADDLENPTLESKLVESGSSINELEAITNGEGIEIQFNARYLLDVLKPFGDTDVILGFTQDTRPLTVEPSNPAEFDVLHVIMPMHKGN